MRNRLFFVKIGWEFQMYSIIVMTNSYIMSYN